MAADVQLRATAGYTSRADTGLKGQIILGFPDVSEGRRNTIEPFAHASLGDIAEALQFPPNPGGPEETYPEGGPARCGLENTQIVATHIGGDS